MKEVSATFFELYCDLSALYIELYRPIVTNAHACLHTHKHCRVHIHPLRLYANDAPLLKVCAWTHFRRRWYTITLKDVNVHLPALLSSLAHAGPT